MITVASVLRTGGHYTAEWVNRLHAGVSRHLPLDHDFVCLTDNERGIDRRVCVEPLQHDWPGWWSKQSLYRPGLFAGLVIYLDLDTVITGDLSDLASYTGERAILRDFYRGGDNVGSGVMLWHGDAMADVWRAFTADPQRIMAANRTRSDTFTGQHMHPRDYVQDLWPTQVVSFKIHARQAVPSNARVVCMHGRPHLTELEPAHWARRSWEQAA